MKSLHSKVTLHHGNGKYHPFMNQPCSVVDGPCYNLTGSTLGIPSWPIGLEYKQTCGWMQGPELWFWCGIRFCTLWMEVLHLLFEDPLLLADPQNVSEVIWVFKGGTGRVETRATVGATWKEAIRKIHALERAGALTPCESNTSLLKLQPLGVLVSSSGLHASAQQIDSNSLWWISRSVMALWDQMQLEQLLYILRKIML